MKITLGAVGRLKDSAERPLFERYWQRLEASGRYVGIGPARLIEIAESRDATPQLRRAAEAQRLLAATGTVAATGHANSSAAQSGSVIVALDERGKALDSAAFAALLRRHRDDGTRALVFLIGGADGHGSAVSAAARLSLSLSALTLPHGLARVVLAEQLYRAVTILVGHPYHRA